jgi:hypothetical protein
VALPQFQISPKKRHSGIAATQPDAALRATTRLGPRLRALGSLAHVLFRRRKRGLSCYLMNRTYGISCSPYVFSILPRMRLGTETSVKYLANLKDGLGSVSYYTSRWQKLSVPRLVKVFKMKRSACCYGYITTRLKKTVFYRFDWLELLLSWTNRLGICPMAASFTVHFLHHIEML